MTGVGAGGRERIGWWWRKTNITPTHTPVKKGILKDSL